MGSERKPKVASGKMQIGRSGVGRHTIAALLVVIALVAPACGKPNGLTVELDWVPNPDHVGIYYAQNKGYFANRNLTVSFRAPSGAADPIKLVGLNKVDLAISYEPEMFYGQQNGLPVVAVATVVPVALNSLIVAPGVSAPSLADMKGKKIGVTGIPSDDAFYLTMLKTAGLTTNDVTKVNVGFNLVTSVLSHKVDGIIGGFQNVEAIQVAQESGQQPTVYPADRLGVPAYAELVLVANATRLRSDPAYADQVKRFVEALVQGTDAARADPAGATAIMKSATQYDAKFLDQSVPYTLKLLAPPPGTKTGCIDSAAWQSYADWMKTSGLLTGSPDASAVISDAYLPYTC